jgi:hypothetical protein
MLSLTGQKAIFSSQYNPTTPIAIDYRSFGASLHFTFSIFHSSFLVFTILNCSTRFGVESVVASCLSPPIASLHWGLFILKAFGLPFSIPNP